MVGQIQPMLIQVIMFMQLLLKLRFNKLMVLMHLVSQPILILSV